MSQPGNQQKLSAFTRKIENLIEADMWARMFKSFDESFVDSPSTLLILDEIQESAYLYNSIKSMRKQAFHLAVCGSCLGATIYDRNYFYPGNDVTRIVVAPLSFQEFLYNIGKLDLYNSLNLFGESAQADYGEMQECYDDYLSVGGYPDAVLSYLELSESMVSGKRSEILSLPENALKIKKFHAEISSVMLTDCDKCLNANESGAARKILELPPQYCVENKAGGRADVYDYLTLDGMDDRDACCSALHWLISNRIIGGASLAKECDLDDCIRNAKLYYNDVGVANFCYNKLGSPTPAHIRGAIAENFVFLELDKLDSGTGPTHIQPKFGVYNKAEIGFLVFSRATKCTFAISAISCKKNSSNISNRLLDEHVVDNILYVKEGTKGGLGAPGILTIPIYLIERFDFDQMINPPLKPSLRRERINREDQEALEDEDEFEDFEEGVPEAEDSDFVQPE
jgi:predicted AAA+ superfamily ATPase